MAIIFQASLDKMSLPNIWKTANVSSIFKKGHRSDPSNYRPISLTCVACKIMESIIKDVVMTYLLENNLLSNCQLGFVSGRSVQLQLQPGGGGVDPIPCVSTHRISDPRSGPAQLLPPTCHAAQPPPRGPSTNPRPLV